MYTRQIDRLQDELLLIDFSRDVCHSTHRVRLRGECEANMSEQSIHNSYESCNLFIQLGVYCDKHLVKVYIQ